MKPACSNLHNKDVIKHAGSMAEGSKSCNVGSKIILKYRTLIKLYTSKSILKIKCGWHTKSAQNFYPF